MWQILTFTIKHFQIIKKGSSQNDAKGQVIKINV